MLMIIHVKTKDKPNLISYSYWRSLNFNPFDFFNVLIYSLLDLFYFHLAFLSSYWFCYFIFFCLFILNLLEISPSSIRNFLIWLAQKPSVVKPSPIGRYILKLNLTLKKVNLFDYQIILIVNMFILTLGFLIEVLAAKDTLEFVTFMSIIGLLSFLN